MRLFHKMQHFAGESMTISLWRPGTLIPAILLSVSFSHPVFAQTPVPPRVPFRCDGARWPLKAVCTSTLAIGAAWGMTNAYWAVYFTKDGTERTTFRDRHVAWQEELEAQCMGLNSDFTASECVWA